MIHILSFGDKEFSEVAECPRPKAMPVPPEKQIHNHIFHNDLQQAQSEALTYDAS